MFVIIYSHLSCSLKPYNVFWSFQKPCDSKRNRGNVQYAEASVNVRFAKTWGWRTELNFWVKYSFLEKECTRKWLLPFCVSFVEQVRVAIWNLSLVMGMMPAWWKDFPVCLSFSSTSAYEPGRVKYVLASSAFFTSTCRNRRGICSGTAYLV